MSKIVTFALDAIKEEDDRKLVDTIKANFTDKSNGNFSLDSKHYEEVFDGQKVTLAQAKEAIKIDRRFAALFTAAAGEDAGVKMQADPSLEEVHHSAVITSGKLIVRTERSSQSMNPRTKETTTNHLNTRVKIESPLVSGSFLTDIRRGLREKGAELIGGESK